MTSPSLKLSRLPDLKPVKMTISLDPELAEDLKIYSEVYREFYGEAKSVADLSPYILRAFIDADAAFKRARKKRSAGGPSAPASRNGKASDASNPTE